MKITFNPSTVAALTTPPNNKDITFDLRGRNIFARGVKFCGTDTNTWRDIKINNVSIGSNILDLRNGSNTTLTNTNGVVTINSTWRPVVDNLTSDSTTSSLSANQGRVLAGLINSKSDSDHNHDDRYVKRSGDTMLSALNFANDTWNRVGDDVAIGNHNVAGCLGIKGLNAGPGLAFYNSSNTLLSKLVGTANQFQRVSGNNVFNILDTSSTYVSNGKGVINGTTITQVDNATNSTNSTNARKLVNWYSARPTSLNTQFGDGSLRIFYATSATTEGKCPDDATVLHLAWDNNGGFDAQLALAHENNNKIYFRSQRDGTWQPWKTLAYLSSNVASASKLQTSRLLWGQPFDGTGDVRGFMKDVTGLIYGNKIGDDWSDGNNTHPWYGIDYRHCADSNETGKAYTSISSYFGLYFKTGGYRFIFDGGNVGIGTNSPAYKLDVVGDIYTTTGFKKNGSSDSYVLLGGGGHKTISSLSVNYANSAGNADTVDGYHANGLLTALSNSDNGISITVGGTTKSISNISVNYASTADSAHKLNKWFDSRVADLNQQFGDGSLRIFHATSSTTANKCPSDATVLHLAWDNNEGWDSQLAVGQSQNKLYFRGQNNYKWNPWQTVLHDGNSSISGNTIKINNTSLTVANSNHNHDNVYLKLAGGTMQDQSRIGVNGNLYIGDADNRGWLYFQDIASQDGTDYWTISTNGSAEFEDIITRSDVSVGGQIYRRGINSSWNKGRDNALLRDTSAIGYHPLWSLKTTNGSWDFGEYNSSGWNNIPVLSYITDSNYNSGNNISTYQIKFPLASGTVALTSDIPNPTNYYWADVKISSSPSTTTFPTFQNLATTNKILRRHRNQFFTQPFFAAYGQINLSTLTFEGNVACTVTKIANNHFKISFDIQDDIYRYLIFLTPIYASGYVGVKYYNSDGRTLDYDLYPSSTSINTVDVMLINFRDYVK